FTRSPRIWRCSKDGNPAIRSCPRCVQVTCGSCWTRSRTEAGGEMNGYNFTDRVRKVLQMAREEAARLHHEYVGTEHMLLGLIREEKGIAAQVLTDAGVNLEQARAETLRLLGSEMPSTAPAGGAAAQPAAPKSEKKSKTPALDHFCRDLTQLAAEGSLDPTIGRQKEIERVMEIHSRRKKNNPVL